jgi:VWFA-related protein
VSIASKVPLSRVEWFLDGRIARATAQPPFDALIDLGETPRLHKLSAIGYTADGIPAGRATTMINDRLEDLRVFLVSPATANVRGSVRVEADAYVPPGHELKGMEFFWNDRPIGAIAKPPYRTEFEAPPDFGYLRVVATLDNGTTAEDAQTFNAGGFGETVDVHQIAFPATVVDKQGNPVRGLRSADFDARDGGEKVDLTVREAQDEPATIGIAIDLSASMHRLLLPAMDIGARIINSVAAPKDQTFLVTFDERPRLLQSLTTDRSLLQTRLFDAHAFGGTALADALAFTIQQFTGTTSRRALILITDGNEGQSTQAAGACIEMAKESGVPIYVIVPRESTETEDGRIFRRVLLEMAEASGGLVFLRPDAGDLDSMVNRIASEIRAQYLLSFAGRGGSPGTWRRLRIAVPGKPVTVRAISGYTVR